MQTKSAQKPKLFASTSCRFRAAYKLQCCRKALPLPATLLATLRVPINSTENDSAHGHCWHKQPSVGVSQWHDKRHGRACCRAWAWGTPCDLNPTVGPTVSPILQHSVNISHYGSFADKKREGEREGGRWKVGSCSTEVGCHRATELIWDTPWQAEETGPEYCLWPLNNVLILIDKLN